MPMPKPPIPRVKEQEIHAPTVSSKVTCIWRCATPVGSGVVGLAKPTAYETFGSMTMPNLISRDTPTDGGDSDGSFVGRHCEPVPSTGGAWRATAVVALPFTMYRA